ncbi:ComEC/Rec2 family competence protein [Umezakia ovalisporum]|uniref:ComEC/Rec2 family competence protein n=2 Tax=Umezakia ovalisporum TaxID=75695 RepID=A0AA43GXS6_9CYAN|nr:ComEC/Rec2 family competence protein [Umezakia ovalisporum]MDH6055463.1 ComEC/Rec2 family competence protein [Umezakia ovalisporum FSS-43]MDH6062793.1 ComEC/Rec2 family competence protein [Umezakia ovalisporum FSS-62]MDH6067943.1 ComEC/Rec2 family competence protein [Umezakia ovalisporum APH033B]MDH6070566.1 ComEC/Rec2 family competence protein [Umezakia ovalisporum CobakiLakeA]MDH6075035.1 ComEC/Rec2 family competence protein [Umezakia ovalisporum CS-1034]
MIQINSLIICLAFILGLLLSATPWGGIGILSLGIVGAVLFRRPILNAGSTTQTIPHISPNVPHARTWLVAGLVGLLATVYCQWREPQPHQQDISTFISSENNSNQQQIVIVRGEVASNPRLTRSQRGQFVLAATQLDEVKNETSPVDISKGVTGKLYVTVPMLQATGLYPGQQIAVTGVLYQPQTASHPGAFDFQKFLQQQGIFAGLTGRQINILDPDEKRKWGWWQIRQRIVRSQVRWLGVPAGPLVSAMVLGSKAIDLPYDVRDLFVKAGLAHTLAASGFQTSLVLGLILQLTRRASQKTQFTCSCLGLIIFVSLTGFQPSVLRAVIMGLAALVGLLLKRKVKQIGSLLLAATILLLINPLWIWDLGFQLSFLATLGLIVTVPALVQHLDWLPKSIASLIAVPLAATIWTLPLQLLVFGVVPAYSLPLNIISTPLVATISIGGIISAISALVWPTGGSALAGLLYYPTDGLIKIVQLFSNFPGNFLRVGSISTSQLLAIYALIILVWLVRWWQRHWWFAGLIAIGLVLTPIWYSANTLFRITILAAGTEPVIVIQDRGTVTLINSGDQSTARFTTLPFLQHQGINKIDSAIASNFKYQNNNTWLELLQSLPIKNFYEYSPNLKSTIVTQAIQKQLQRQQGIYQPLAPGQTVKIGSVVAQFIKEQLPVLQLQIQGENWLLVGNVKSTEVEKIVQGGTLLPPQVLWCSPQLLKDLLQKFQPQVAIASHSDLDSKTLSELTKNQTKLFFTKEEGAIQWTPNSQFEAFIQPSENKSIVF